MSYSFGWWDFVDDDQPAMVNRFSEERIVRRGPLASSDAPADEPWFRFDYLAEDLTYPLAVRWSPERGEILLDHNKSAAIWRRETGAAAGPPAFGTFMRVDDLVPDALWCWPGVIDTYFRQLVEDTRPPKGWNFSHPSHKGRSPLTLFHLGGYQNGCWRALLVAEEVNDINFSPMPALHRFSNFIVGHGEPCVWRMIQADEFHREYARLPQYRQRVLLAPDAPAPSPLEFVDLVSHPDVSADHPEWMRRILATEPSPPHGYRITANAPVTPHAISLDRNRLISHPGTLDGLGHAGGPHWILRLDFMGLPITETKVWPGSQLKLGPYMGGPYHTETTWICQVDGSEPSRVPLRSGVVRLADYEEWLMDHATGGIRSWREKGMDVSLQQRDFIDALFLFSRVVEHDVSPGPGHRRTPEQETFDCIASCDRFLGGRVVDSRVKFNYLADA